jgi:hypothetical protein
VAKCDVSPLESLQTCAQLHSPLVSGETLDSLSGRLTGKGVGDGEVGGGVGGCVGAGGGGVAVDMGELVGKLCSAEPRADTVRNVNS